MLGEDKMMRAGPGFSVSEMSRSRVRSRMVGGGESDNSSMR